MAVMIKPVTIDAFETLWPLIEPVVRAGETYAYPRDASLQEMQHIWFAGGTALVFAAYASEESTEVVGTYYIKANQMGPAAHTANAGFITAAQHSGKGIASAMADHMLSQAKLRGYRAVQFNMVVENNTASLAIWDKRGFSKIGYVPEAYQMPDGTFIGAHIMHKKL